MTVHLIHARTEPNVLILLEVIAVIARLDTLEATVKQVNFKTLYFSIVVKYPLVCTLIGHRTKVKKLNCQRYFFLSFFLSYFRHQ